MAYQGNMGRNNFQGRSNTSTSSTPVSKGPVAGKSEALFSSGLFAPDSGKSKALATVRTKEAITIPAGSYINVYEVEKKGDKSPVLRLQIRESKPVQK